MNKQLDMTGLMQDFFAAFPVDVNAFQDVSKNSVVLGEKLTSVALNAAEKSAEISAEDLNFEVQQVPIKIRTEMFPLKSDLLENL